MPEPATTKLTKRVMFQNFYNYATWDLESLFEIMALKLQ